MVGVHVFPLLFFDISHVQRADSTSLKVSLASISYTKAHFDLCSGYKAALIAFCGNGVCAKSTRNRDIPIQRHINNWFIVESRRWVVDIKFFDNNFKIFSRHPRCSPHHTSPPFTALCNVSVSRL